MDNNNKGNDYPRHDGCNNGRVVLNSVMILIVIILVSYIFHVITN